MSKAWVKVAGCDDLEPDSVQMVRAGKCLIALVRTQTGYSALDNMCPHRGGPLGQGSIEDGKLVCPWHGHAFDLSDGASEGLAVAATCYRSEQRDDGIYVEIDGDKDE